MSNKLVSVVVISYNSGTTILETLESIYNQTYPDIELIVSDDCSSDDSAELAKQWAQTHEDRFVRCLVHKNPENLGVPGNLNTGILLSGGHYIKVLAADDLLRPDCVALNEACCEENGYDVLCSRVCTFSVHNGEKIPGREIQIDAAFFEKNVADQYRDELVENRVMSPTLFIARTLFDEIGMYDTRYRFMEDYPMYVKLLKHGHKIHFLDACTVEYRMSENSISNAVHQRSVHPGYFQTVKMFFYKERLLGLLKNFKIKRILWEMRRFLYTDVILLMGNDRRKASVRFLEAMRDKTWRKKKQPG